MSDLPPPPLEPPPPPLSYGGPPAPGGSWPRGGQIPPQLGGAFYSTGLVILLTVVTCGIWSMVWSYRTGDDLQRYNGDGLGGALMLLIAVLVSPVVMFIVPSEIERMYQRDGRQSPVGALLGLWLLLPLIGHLIWYVKVQSALNGFWLSKGARPG
ncbi:MAG: DUF4234 domain-containing protein [Desertimonas sp.]